MEKSGFFNSVNGDRKYKASDFAEYFNSFVSNGVFPNPSNNLQVMSSNNMTIILSPGKAWINGYIYISTTDVIQAIGVADGALNRIDRLVLKFDTLNRNIKSIIKKGVFASNPVAPSLQRDADSYEIGIADIYIAKGATSITQANITDLRLNNTYCGIVNSIMQADTTTLFNQYTQGFEIKKAEFEQVFNDWFATIQAALDGDTAGNLLNLITNHKSDKNNPHGVTAAQIGAAKQTDFASHLADNTVHGIGDYGNCVTEAASFTPTVLYHLNKVVAMINNTAITITVPTYSTAAFPNGTQITFMMHGPGSVTFAPASGVYLCSKDTKRTIDGQYSSATLIKYTDTVWWLIGALK